MKKAMGLLLTVLLFLACTGALAERTVVAKMTDLLDAPDEKAQTLMRYYVGVEVDVVRDVDAAYVQVNVGEPGGSLMGYMKKEHLAMGETAAREVIPYIVECSADFKECTLYSAPDMLSPVVNRGFYVEGASVLGYLNEAWLHVVSDYGGTGFVSLEELGEVRRDVREAKTFGVEPMENELSIEAAIEEAKRILLEDYASGANHNMGMGELTREGLDASSVEVRVHRYAGYKYLHYEVDFRDPMTQEYYAWIILDVEDMDVVSHSYGNG